MIHMSQVKVPIEQIIKKAPKDLVRHGKIGKEEEWLVKKETAKLLRMDVSEIQDFVILRKSMDARKKQKMHYTYQVNLSCAKEEKRVRQYGKNDARIEKNTYVGENTDKPKERCVEQKEKSDMPPEKKSCYAFGAEKKLQPVVVGFGPAGMFAALELARAGMAPIVLERGLPVKERQQTVDTFWKEGILDEECNVQFGEGGAGTFSDGKLNTMVKDADGRNRLVLKTFVAFGAPSEILYLQKPHIGTDCLKDVVQRIRSEILRLGGEIYFSTRLDGLLIEKGRLEGAMFVKNGKQEQIACDRLILATGHSARDTFSWLKECGVRMEPKAFAVGVRVEHPQEMIGQNQYGAYYTKLPTADYKVTYQTAQKRGVYSFCMCPGGYVVNASSEKGRLAVNGMSNYKRDGKNANSAIVVTVSPQDFGSDDVLAGMAFQRKYEEAAFRAANGKIPVQLLGDFLQSKVSTSFGGFLPEMRGEYAFGNVRTMLPDVIGDSIAEGMLAFDRRLKGFAREDTILSGIESRTSSPVRICRDENLQSNLHGLYPCGEGAGYAGGITSAAMDGIRVAQEVINTCR